MTANPCGFLLVMMQCPPALEDEFNAWYDSEHIPERLSVPGFLTGLRFVSESGHPKYLAMYDLESADVLSSPAYVKVGYDNASPWTKRVTSRVRIYRSFGRQVAPGRAVTQPCARLSVIRFRGLNAGAETAMLRGLESCYGAKPETIQTRLLAYDTGGSGTDYLAVIEFRAKATDYDPAAFGTLADAIDLYNVYAPY